MVGFFVDRKSTSWPPISGVGSFCVSVLSAEQAEMSRRFAVTSIDKFAGVRWRAAPSGHPVIAGAVAWIDCRLESETAAGDHVFVLGEVLDLDVESGGTPLLHHRGEYRRAEDLESLPEDVVPEEPVGR